MIRRKPLSKILYAASAALLLAACTDRPTEPDATSSIPNCAPADPSALNLESRIQCPLERNRA